jgi:uncharacterized membrane protein YdbT with pleckstrin-like domain
MSYVNSVLGTAEMIKYEADVSLLAFLPRFIFGGLLVLVGLFTFTISINEKVWDISAENILGCALLLWGLYAMAVPIIEKETTELVITNRRIIAKFGLISRYTIEINLQKIESISVSQSIFGRILNYGDLQIIGTGGTIEPIPNIGDPLMFRRKFDETLNN